MGDMVQAIFTGFTDVIEGLGSGIKTAFETLLWQDPTASTKVISDPVQFALIFFGVSLAISLVFGIFSAIKRRN